MPTATVASPRTWTFVGHEDAGVPVVDYYVPGAQDLASENRHWDEGRWSASAAGADVAQAQAAAIAKRLDPAAA